MNNKPSNRNLGDFYTTSDAESYEQAIERLKKQDEITTGVRFVSSTIPAEIEPYIAKHTEEVKPVEGAEWIIKPDAPKVIYDVADEVKHTEERKRIRRQELPRRLLDVGGLIGDVADHTYNNAPVPNKVLAFVGAMALMSYLLGRKVKGISGVRPNMYLLGLGYSTSGKDFARKINDEIIHAIGKDDEVGDSLGSGEGLEDALYRSKNLLLQTDEIDGMLDGIKSGKEPRYEKIMNILLKMYTSSSSNYKMRIKAGQASIGTIKEPSLALFGTAVPTYYYSSLSERMLNNGFFGRMLVFQGYKAEQYREREPATVNDDIIKRARFWRNFNQNTGNLGDTFYCNPVQIPHAEDCKPLIKEFSDKVFYIKGRYEEAGNNGAITVWGRAIENAFKLALLKACSDCVFIDDNYSYYEDVIITRSTMAWAIEITEFLINNALISVESVVGDDPIRVNAKKVYDAITATKKGYATRSFVKNKTNLSLKILNDAISDLIEDGIVEERFEAVGGSHKKSKILFLK